MTRTRSGVFHRLLFFALLAPIFSFQTKQPAPAPGTKYIFYWGAQQCELTEANGFKGKMTAIPSEFRQMLLSTPRLWNGTAILGTISFKFEGRPVDTEDYVSQIGALDTAFGQKAVPGQVFQLTGLNLDGRTVASIEINIREPEQKKETAGRGMWQSAPASFLNSNLLERVIWGREDIYDTSNRDFFTVTEFWQTVQQLPVVEWKRNATPKPIAVSVQFPDVGNTTFGVGAALEPEDYRRLQQNLENYRHLVKPGATVSLLLKTAEQHDELFQKRLVIVPDNDPRLALRRNRDAHTLTIRWGGWYETIEHLYLVRMSDAQGQILPVDQPIARGRGCSRADALAMLALRPELWIDDQLLPDFSYHLASDSSSATIGPGENVPETFTREIKSSILERGMLQMDSFQVAGYDLPPTTLFLNFFEVLNRQQIRNDFKALMAATGSVRIKLNPPTADKTDLYFEITVPELAKITLSIFEPEGAWNVFTLDESFSAGPHLIRVPRSVFRNNGKHFCFLNTPFGVAKQEFMLQE
jgi:hypothetical protein